METRFGVPYEDLEQVARQADYVNRFELEQEGLQHRDDKKRIAGMNMIEYIKFWRDQMF